MNDRMRTKLLLAILLFATAVMANNGTDSLATQSDSLVQALQNQIQ